MIFHLARRKPAGRLDQAVGERRFAVIDMGDDREIADMGEIGHAGRHIAAPIPAVQPLKVLRA
jgi:hypothetical protein